MSVASLLDRAENLTVEAKTQIAVSAAAVAIYVTASGPNKPSSKLASLKAATTTISSLHIKLPVVIQVRLAKTMASLEEEVKESRKDVKKPARK